MLQAVFDLILNERNHVKRSKRSFNIVADILEFCHVIYAHLDIENLCSTTYLFSIWYICIVIHQVKCPVRSIYLIYKNRKTGRL